MDVFLTIPITPLPLEDNKDDDATVNTVENDSGDENEEDEEESEEEVDAEENEETQDDVAKRYFKKMYLLAILTYPLVVSTMKWRKLLGKDRNLTNSTLCDGKATDQNMTPGVMLMIYGAQRL